MHAADHATTRFRLSPDILAPMIGWLALALVLVFVHLRLLEYLFDDAYIHVRIAERLASTGTPYFNAGEAVNASSSSAWTILLAVLFKVTGVSLVAVALAEAILTTACAAVYRHLMKSLAAEGIGPGSSAVFLILTISILLPVSTGLMEIPLALLILGIGLVLYFRDKPMSFLFFGIAIFGRLELALFAVLFLCHSLLARRMQPLASVAWLAAGIAPFLLYNLAFFGAVIPATLNAKAIVYTVARSDAILTALIQPVSAWPPDLYLWALASMLSVTLLAFGVALLQLVVRRDNVPKSFAVAALLALGGLGVISGYLAKPVLIFPWYVPLYTFPLFLACFYFLSQAKWPLLVRLVTLLLALPFAAASVQIAAASLGNPQRTTNFVANARVRQYTHVGRYLSQVFPDATLLTSEIGALGFSFPGRILDGAGLVSPDALRYHPLPVPEERSSGETGAIPVLFIEDHLPELIVSYDVFVEAFLRSDLLTRYYRVQLPIYLADDLIHVGSNTLWSSKALNIFIRKDVFLATTRFGDAFEFAFPALSTQRVRQGDSLELRMFWRSLILDQPNYQRSCFILNADQQPVMRPVSASLSTAPGLPDAVVFDECRLATVGLSPGEYAVAVSVNRDADRSRLPILRSGVTVEAGYLIVDRFQVIEG